MHTFILFLGFCGAWLLVAGPLYQAALELREQDIEADRIRATGEKITRAPRVSAWWWLFPPAKLPLERARSNNYKRQYVAAQLPEDVEALVSFMSKATAWMMVAAGGLCIAIKETYELVEHLEWSNLVFAALLVGMSVASILNTVIRVKRQASISRNLKQRV